MSVKKIFMTLIIAIACVMIGAFLLNVIVPNASNLLINQIENQIYKATGMVFDFNNDGVKGSNNNTAGIANAKSSGKNDAGGGGAEVDGWSK